VRHIITVLAGDGIGPSVVAQARKVLAVIEQRWDLKFDVREHPIGGAALELTGTNLPVDTVAAARESSAVLLGAVGDPAWDQIVPTSERPTASLLRLRTELGLHTGVRPVSLPTALSDLSPLRTVAEGSPVDVLIVRELSAGLFAGKPRGRRISASNEEEGFDTMNCSPSATARVAGVAFALAARRRGLVTSVDQANVLESSAVWREQMTLLGASHSGVTLEHMLIDNCANELVRRPDRFDVIVTDGLFGGILSDEAGAVTGSIGMLASASLGAGPGIFEPVHGSAPAHADRDEVNPIGAIRSLALLLELGLNLPAPARAIEAAVVDTVAAGYRTYDITRPDCVLVGTDGMGDRIADQLLHGEIDAFAGSRLADG
jgi:3-isopropylmalate dehydrogenase